MKKVLYLLPLAALLAVGFSPTASATTKAATVVNRIPVEWAEGWSDGRYFVIATNAQYGQGSAQSRDIIQAEMEAYLNGADFNDLDGYGKGYVHALRVAIR